MTQLPSFVSEFLSDVGEQASLKYLCFRGFLLRRERASSTTNHFLCRLTAIVVCTCMCVLEKMKENVSYVHLSNRFMINNIKIQKGMCILMSFINTQGRERNWTSRLCAYLLIRSKALSGKRNYTFPNQFQICQ